MKTFFIVTTIFFFLTTIIFILKFESTKKFIPAKGIVKSLDSSLEVPVIRYTDSQGIEHAVIDETVNHIISQEATKAAEEIADNLDIEPEQVQSGTTISTSILQDSIKFLQKEIVSLNQTAYYYKDKYLSLTVRTDTRGDSTLDQSDFDFSYNADLNIVQYWKRTKIPLLGLPVGSKKSYTVISSTDPRVTIKGVKKFTVVQNQPVFGLRAGVRGTYNTFNQNAAFGPYARFDLGMWTVNGSYLYNVKTQKPGLVIGLDRDLIRF